MSEEKRTVRFTVDVNADLHLQAKMKALNAHAPLTEVVRRLLKGWVAGEIEVNLTGDETEEATE